MFNGLVTKFCFPVPEPSYTADWPLRIYTIDGYYNEIDPPGKYSYQEFEANMFWAGDTPCVAFPHPQRANKVIIYAHANHEDVWRTHALLQTLRDLLGVHCVGFEYPGYGPAPGRASEADCLESLRRVYRHLRDECRFAPGDIILFGRSIGTGICTRFAAENQVLALMLLSPFTSIKAVVQSGGGHKTLGGMAASLINDCFTSVKAIRHVAAPVLILHGEQDSIVPSSHGVALHKAAGTLSCKLKLFPEMGHNDVFDDEHRERLLAQIKLFVDPLLKTGESWFKRDLAALVGAAHSHSPARGAPAEQTQVQRDEIIGSIQLVLRSISQQAQQEALDRDPEAVAALAMNTLTKLQIVFEEADVLKQRHLGPDQLHLLLSAAYAEYCDMPEVSADEISKDVKEAFELYDIKGEGQLEFLSFVEMLCGHSRYELPIHPEVKLQIRLLASKGGWDGLELRFV